MYKLTLISLLITLCCFSLKAQNNCQCNEYTILKNNKQDDSTIAVKLISSTSILCKAKGYELMGNFLIKAGETDSAELMLQQAETAYRKTGCGDSILLYTYKYWAQLFHAKGEFVKAQEKSFQMLTAAEAAGNVYEIAISNLLIAQMFNQTNQAGKGIVFTRKAELLAEKITDATQKGDIYFKISKRLLWHYQDTKEAGSLDSSELYSNLQLQIARSLNSKSLKASAFANLQGVAWERWMTNKSNSPTQTDQEGARKVLILLDSAFKYSDTAIYNVMGALYSDKADLLINLKDYKQAKIAADSSIYYRDKTGNIAYKVYGYDLLSSIYKGTGDYKNAYEFYVKSKILKDSLADIEKTKQVTELERKYSQAKNENTIKDLAKKKQLYLFLAIAGLLAALAIAFYLRQQSLKHKKNILETEQRLNRARMNPHFFFNALTTLQKFALRENDGQAMATNLSKFSNIMRETLESSYKEYVTIEQEIDFLNEYLEVQKIRFPQTFSYEVTATSDLEIDELLIPAMIIQPFVENSIEHGFVGVDYPGHVSVQFSNDNPSSGQAGKELLIQITDNGKGLSTTAKENNEHISRASQIIKDRIYLLNIKLKTRAGFRIDNNTTGKGVIVKIHLPLLYKDQINSE